jgi:uncharacterized integral membrane protein
MRVFKAILVIFLFFLTVTFSLQNMEEVKVHYYGLIDSFTAPLFVVLLAAVLIGVIIGALGGMLSNIQLRIVLRRQRKEAEEMRRELESLKGEPSPKTDLSPGSSSSE